MIISESHLDSIVHAVSQKLGNVGIELDSDLLSDLNDTLTVFLSENCDVTTQETVSFAELSGEQWIAWMELARDAQSDRGESGESISSEETEREAEHLFGLHEGIIPVCQKNKAVTLSSKTPESIIKASKTAAANCVFDLESEEKNAQASEALTAETIFDAVQLSSSLGVNVDGQRYLIEPYWPFISDDNALEILEDVRHSVEAELLRQHNDLTQSTMEDWRIAENAPIPDSHRKTFRANIDMGNQITIEIKQENGEPSLGLLIEINHGTPALHIDVDGGDSLLHIHKGQGGLVITPEERYRSFEPAVMDEESYHTPNSVVIATP